ncbi:NAD(P)-dependent alcohol dehydrogenase [Microvirga sp. STR05]|uniref:NAD(P)-dependent alcohol dehydrogenase n=1 Tax=Hymenobacter duratus TaxID=2771356 RepID=A0ABR8JKD4_9BACT|nr:NAD(P)-dependent alcohol dehydrogenase [Hymenobacter duratus]MBD2714984.1 NAD(P)-dependent alcohol dehydrogenase [Hymenobacter duratus]MBR7949890.1 NAD(P)-dependent alcohol dehydrogenase [Microvirga sp. STR05]
MIPAKGYAAQSPTTDPAPWNFERRDVGAHDVQIEILFCGVCHSDLHQIRNEWFPGIFPMVPGHEIVGRITKVGEHVKKFKVDELAGVGCMVDSCQVCVNCKDGLEQYCLEGNTQTYNNLGRDGAPTYGGYSNTIVVREEFVVHVSEKLNLAAVSPLLCAGITTYSPLRYWKVGAGHKLAVVGLGGLGHMGVKFGVAFGADVTVLSTSPSKEADAKALGAHHFVVTKDEAQLEAVKGSFDFILDTVAADHDIPLYLSLLKTSGTHILVGAPPKPMEIPAFALIPGRKSVSGSTIGGIAETQEMLDFCAEHNIVSDIELIDIKDIAAAYERMVKGDVRYRFVIDLATL